MTDPIVKTALLFTWSPDVAAGQLVETSAHPDVTMRLEHVVLASDDWQLVGIDIGALCYRVTSRDLRHLDLPPVGPSSRVGIRARNTTEASLRFPGAQILGVVIR